MATPAASTTRFAHPFFNNTPPARRTRTPEGTRMTDHIERKLEKIPAVKGKSIMTLADIIGVAGATEVEKSGKVLFHSTGDTGKRADSPQGDVAAAMTKDFDIDRPTESPSFFLHLGDVIYGHTKDQGFRQEFYEPYMHYPGKIVAIPGNHDGEVFPKTDPVSLRAFLANFCTPKRMIPQIAGTIFRQTMTQPGVYWKLETTLVDIIGLYSNVAENPGFISGAIPGQAQKKWLVERLKEIAKERKGGTKKGLVFAVHHPPISTAGHSGSAEMLKDVDDACDQAGVMPNVFLAAHSHTYQRYTRRITFNGKALVIPFIVCGVGGFNAQPVQEAHGEVTGDHSFDKSRHGYGYLLLEASKTQIAIRTIGVDGTTKEEIERITVPL